MDYITELTAIASEHGGIIETKIAAQHGISKAMLYKLCKEGKIHRIVKGQYILPDDMQDERYRTENERNRPYNDSKGTLTWDNTHGAESAYRGGYGGRIYPRYDGYPRSEMDEPEARRRRDSRGRGSPARPPQGVGCAWWPCPRGKARSSPQGRPPGRGRRCTPPSAAPQGCRRCGYTRCRAGSSQTVQLS